MSLFNLLCLLGLFSFNANALTTTEIRMFVARPHTEKNTKEQGNVLVTHVHGTSPGLLITSNGVPDHNSGTFPGLGPNHIKLQKNAYTIPLYPTTAPNTTCLPQGAIGIAINGVSIYNPYTRTCCNAAAEELDLIDECHGHPSPAGVYHYHILPKCLFDIKCGFPSSIIGVAFDGFPIYGPIDEDGKLLTKEDLDECNGKYTNGQYRYHVTNEFPYIIGCYKGVVRTDSGLRRLGSCQCTEPTDPCTEFENRKPRPGPTKRVTSIISCNETNVSAVSPPPVRSAKKQYQQMPEQPLQQTYLRPKPIYPTPPSRYGPRPRRPQPMLWPFPWLGR